MSSFVPQAASFDERAAGLYKIQRIMNRKFPDPPFQPLRGSGFSGDASWGSLKSAPSRQQDRRNIEGRDHHHHGFKRSHSSDGVRRSRPQNTWTSPPLRKDSFPASRKNKSPQSKLSKNIQDMNSRKIITTQPCKRFHSNEFNSVVYDNKKPFLSSSSTLDKSSRDSLSPILTLNSSSIEKHSPHTSMATLSCSDFSQFTCDIFGDFSSQLEADQFDPEKMPVPIASAKISLRHEFHRRSKSVGHPDYSLGQAAKEIDMIKEATLEAAKLATSLLRQFDMAFIKRSNGTWCYAMLIERVQPENDYDEWALRFVVDESGGTKTIKRYDNFGRYVRLIKEPIEVNIPRLKKPNINETTDVLKPATS
ncbi:hypothetical protein ACHAXS_009118 [Conticribra weissflogii]